MSLGCVPRPIPSSLQGPPLQDTPTLIPAVRRDLCADTARLSFRASLRERGRGDSEDDWQPTAVVQVVTRMGGNRSLYPSVRVCATDVPWFCVCREVKAGVSRPSWEVPFMQRLISVKSGRDFPMKLHPLLIPPEIMYFGHSSACSSSLCLRSEPIRRDNSNYSSSSLLIAGFIITVITRKKRESYT